MNPFDALAAEYDAWYDENPEAFRRQLDILRPWVKQGPGLEIGVGTGRFASELGLDFGVDTAPGALEIARKRGIKCVLGDASALPFGTGVFATVGVFFTLEFLDEPAACLREGQRVLRSRGRLVIMHIPPEGPLGSRLEQKRARGHRFYSRIRAFYREGDIRAMARGLAFLTRENPTGPSVLVFEKP